MTRRFAPFVGALIAIAACLAAPSAPIPPEKPRSAWPMFGGTPGRNMVNLTDRDIPHNFDPETGEGILWAVPLGDRSCTQPVVAGGKVFVGTNNAQPRNGRDLKVLPG